MTIRINIEVDSWKDFPEELANALPEMLAFLSASKSLDAMAEMAAMAEEQAEAPHPSPLPASGERERVEEVAAVEPDELPSPHAEIIALLKADIVTADVTTILIEPLVAKWPELRGDPKYVLSKTADKFKSYRKGKLEFAREWLLKGNHALFPDYNEIYAALGRYESYKDREKEGAAA